MIYLYIFAGLLLFAFLWAILEQKVTVKTEYFINSGRKGIVSERLTFVVLSDIHNVRFPGGNKSLLRKIFKLNPDFVIIAGDLITKRKPCYPGNAYNLVKVLSDYYPIYYAYGNHEQRFEDMECNPDPDVFSDKKLVESWAVFKTKLAELGVYILHNKSVTIRYKDNIINITGLSLASEFYASGKPPKLEQEEIINKIGKRDREAYQILIAHNPVYFKEYVRWGADLVISGHVHGGLIRLPFIGGVISPQVRLFPKYDAGLFEENGRYMIVSRGLGTHSFMPRIFNPPELVVINLKAD